jgi:hypothetical protein
MRILFRGGAICTGFDAKMLECPRQAWLFRAFHRQMAVFDRPVLETTTKYKILWFVVDMHHRERYFFICGC